MHFMLAVDNCPYKTPSELLREFDRKWPLGEGDSVATGTRIVMWGLRKDVHVKRRAGDIIVDAPPGAPSHARSLRSYAEVL